MPFLMDINDLYHLSTYIVANRFQETCCHFLDSPFAPLETKMRSASLFDYLKRCSIRTLFNCRHSSRSPQVFTFTLVEIQNKTIKPSLECFSITHMKYGELRFLSVQKHRKLYFYLILIFLVIELFLLILKNCKLSWEW